MHLKAQLTWARAHKSDQTIYESHRNSFGRPRPFQNALVGIIHTLVTLRHFTVFTLIPGAGRWQQATIINNAQTHNGHNRTLITHSVVSLRKYISTWKSKVKAECRKREGRMQFMAAFRRIMRLSLFRFSIFSHSRHSTHGVGCRPFREMKMSQVSCVSAGRMAKANDETSFRTHRHIHNFRPFSQFAYIRNERETHVVEHYIYHHNINANKSERRADNDQKP